MKLEIEHFDAWKVFTEDGKCYMRVAADLPDKGLVPIWYVATRSGWESLPDATTVQLENAFKQEQKGNLQ